MFTFVRLITIVNITNWVDYICKTMSVYKSLFTYVNISFYYFRHLPPPLYQLM